jgi:hypothetical protein
MVSNANTKAVDTELTAGNDHQGFILFEQIPCIVSDLQKSDLFHTMQIGILDHFQNWRFHISKTHERLDKNNAI